MTDALDKNYKNMKKESQTSSFMRNNTYAKVIMFLLMTAGNITFALADGLSTGIPSVLSVQQVNAITVNGVVKDKSGDPIVGATVTEKGNAKNGAITDIDGKYSLRLPAGKIITVSYVGFKTAEFKATSTHHNFSLEEDLTDLNEVVVVGYGTQKKADVTSSVASVKAKDFNTGSVLDAGQLVQGKVAGLNISLPLKYGTLDWDNKIDVAGDQTPVKLGGLYDEWGWEFACEAQRRTQMIRFGTFTTKNWFNHTAITDGHTAIFPIPLSAMETNGNLKQNPGYESNR